MKKTVKKQTETAATRLNKTQTQQKNSTTIAVSEPRSVAPAKNRPAPTEEDQNQ
jgi:hypothetical protein